jgi:hypothetical protein
MSKFSFPRLRLDWLELLLLSASVALVFQMFPWLWWSIYSRLDPRTWSRSTWFVLNAVVLLVLFGVKLGPGLYEDFRSQRAERASKLRRKARVAESAAADSNSTASLGETRLSDDDYQARLQRDAEWRDRAKKRHPWR